MSPEQSSSTLRGALHRHLDPQAWPYAGLSPLNWGVAILIAVSIIFGVVATEPAIMGRFGPSLILIDRLILGLFAIEYSARLWTAGLNPRFSGAKGLIRYVLQPASLADLIVIAPLFFSAPPTWVMIFRLLRILRLVRLASFPHIQNALTEFAEALRAKTFELAITAGAGVLLILISSTALFLIEGKSQPESFGSIPRAMWWSVVTFTTVGYGDAVPETTLGRICAGGFAIAGLGLVAMLTGVIAAALNEAAEIHARNREDDG